MSLSAVRQGLVDRLGSIDGLRVYETPPPPAPEFPAVVLNQAEPFAAYDQAMGSADVRYYFQVLLLVSSADEAQALADLEPYVSPTGASSVKTAVDGDLGGSADWARVVGVAAAGRITHHRASYWGAVFRVEVYVSG
jgi:hypothetical protein